MNNATLRHLKNGFDGGGGGGGEQKRPKILVHKLLKTGGSKRIYIYRVNLGSSEEWRR
jgi:hypothetical protein